MIARTPLLQNAVFVAGSALAYYWLCRLNATVFSHFDYSYGVTWIFLPSGLRLVLTLVFGRWGALGIGLASFIMGYEPHPEGDVVAFLGTGIISGASPLLALWICRRRFGLDVLLEKLTGVTLLKMAVVFALCSSVMHQLWYFLRGHTDNIFSSAGVMMTGDLLGTLVMLYLAKLIIFTLSARRLRNRP